MDNSNMTKERFKGMVDKASPNSALFTNCVKAFFSGGLICCLGQFLSVWYQHMGLSKDAAGTMMSVSLIFLAALLTGLGVFDKIAEFAGAGAVVPITGFANSITAPAVEFKKEGFVFGVGAKIFVIAGPVIVYGLASSALVGIVYYFFKL